MNFNQQKQKVTGIVERVTFHNPENGFCVIKIKVYKRKDLVTVIGNSPTILAGEHVEVTGIWIQDKEHGLQFKADMLKATPPTSLEGIEKYLSSGLIKGIGPIYAKKLVEAFGEDVLDIIETQHIRLKTIPGIGSGRAMMIKKSWDTQKAIREIMLFLHSHNIGTSRAVRIYRQYGSEAVTLIKENPYRLATDIKGIGFKSADQIATSIGIAKDSIIRARAGINHTLASSMDSGNCGLPTLKLIKSCQEILEIDEQLVTQALKLEIEEKIVAVDTIEGQEHIFLKGLYHAEEQIAQQLVKMSRGKALSWSHIEDDKAIDYILNEENIRLSNSQQQAISWALRSGFMVITGGPGVGKTTLINSILKILHKAKVEILLAAPTGRAAKRLTEATGFVATTIHRLLKRNPDQEFHKNVSIKCQLLIIDEASMLDVPLMHAVLKSLPEYASLFLVGDIDQLPSVGAGQVLSDIINSEGMTTVALTEVFRQSQESNIITNAHRVNQGLMPILKANPNKPAMQNDFFFIEIESPEEAAKEIVGLVKTRLPSKFGTSPFTDIQVLCPMTRGVVGTRNLNLELQKVLVPSTSAENEVQVFGSCFRQRDKVMQTVNNYDKDVYNGDMGVITRINREEQEVIINFDGKDVLYEFNELDEIVLSYATTIHKSQGSEYHTVIIPLMMQHYTMLQRNLIYTAITRAKKLVIIVGQKKALSIAVSKASASNRCSTLKQRIVELTGWY